MRLPLDLSNGGWHMPKSLNFRHVNRYSEDRTSQDFLVDSLAREVSTKERFQVHLLSTEHLT